MKKSSNLFKLILVLVVTFQPAYGLELNGTGLTGEAGTDGESQDTRVRSNPRGEVG